MTRINCVPVEELCDQHLLAEYRELPRVFGLVQGAIARGEQPHDRRNPLAYTLGRGHCRFFYPRLLFLHWRHLSLVKEAQARGFQLTFTYSLRGQHGDIPSAWWGDWEPGAAALALNRARLAERLATMSPRFTLHGGGAKL